ncbi:unnamed protein product, partial [Closterium sp. Naga37s-1]
MSSFAVLRTLSPSCPSPPTFQIHPDSLSTLTWHPHRTMQSREGSASANPPPFPPHLCSRRSPVSITSPPHLTSCTPPNCIIVLRERTHCLQHFSYVHRHQMERMGDITCM